MTHSVYSTHYAGTAHDIRIYIVLDF